MYEQAGSAAGAATCLRENELKPSIVVAIFVPIVVSILVFSFSPTMIAKATDKGKD